MGVRLELDGQALERLIGGNSEIEMHLRKNIVEEFAKKHLRSLVNAEAYGELTKAWTAEIKQVCAALREEIESRKPGERDMKHHMAPLLETIRDIAKREVEKTIKEALEAIPDGRIAVMIRQEVRKEIERIVRQEVSQQIEEQIKTQIKNAVKQRMEMLAKTSD